MPTMNSVYGGDWLNKEWLAENGGTRTLTIRDGREVVEHDDGKKQVVLKFDEVDVKLGLNTTNFGLIKDLLDEPNSDLWAGGVVELYIDPNVMMSGKRVGGVRVRNASLNGTGGGGHSSPPVDAGKDTLGESGRDALLKTLREKSVAIGALREKLQDDGVMKPEIAGLDPSVWPTRKRSQIKDAIDALTIDIPF